MFPTNTFPYCHQLLRFSLSILWSTIFLLCITLIKTVYHHEFLLACDTTDELFTCYMVLCCLYSLPKCCSAEVHAHVLHLLINSLLVNSSTLHQKERMMPDILGKQRKEMYLVLFCRNLQTLVISIIKNTMLNTPLHYVMRCNLRNRTPVLPQQVCDNRPKFCMLVVDRLRNVPSYNHRVVVKHFSSRAAFPEFCAFCSAGGNDNM